MSTILPPDSIRSILSKNLAIPHYQRPYKWKVKHVFNLISDVEHERCKSYPKESGYRYRIGSVILHEEDGNDNIVDGQQRLLSIGLILSVIAPDEIKGKDLFKINFTNRVTLENLSYNYEQIKGYFDNWGEKEKDLFAKYLLDGCEMIIIKASNIAEAFQLFDSQNARGKTLDPADLLKAFHLRSMEDEHEKRMCVDRWEESIDRKLLYPVLSSIIYRCRRWMRRDYAAYDFSNDVIDEFKGIDVDFFKQNSGRIPPYLQRLHILSQLNSFSIDEPIANGKRFFDYVDHYVAIYEKLFPGIDDYQVNSKEERLAKDNEYQHLVRKNCFYTPKMYRTGDSRLRNALYCMLVAYYDKFGDDGYPEFFKFAYQYVFQVRLELKQIGKSSIRDSILQGNTTRREPGDLKNPFEWIVEAYRAVPLELRAHLRLGNAFTVNDLNKSVR